MGTNYTLKEKVTLAHDFRDVSPWSTSSKRQRNFMMAKSRENKQEPNKKEGPGTGIHPSRSHSQRCTSCNQVPPINSTLSYEYCDEYSACMVQSPPLNTQDFMAVMANVLNTSTPKYNPKLPYLLHSASTAVTLEH